MISNSKLFDQFKRTVKLFEKLRIPFAVAGGLAASVYRQEERLTKDLDFIITAAGDVEEIAKQILTELGLKPTLVRQADLAGGPMFAIKKRNTPVCIVAGRSDDKETVSVDLLLNRLRWVESAIERAQNFQIDFGFGALPCLTLEDLIVAKLDALYCNSQRLKDLDDLQSIFSKQPALDLPYLAKAFANLKIRVPEVAKAYLPIPLKRALRIKR